MDFLLKINEVVNNFVWGPVMLILLVGTGIYLTIGTKFFTFNKLGYVLKNTLLKAFDKSEVGEGEVTPFQAMSTALAATVGTGNIAGVAAAIAIGGPGAIFWMWISALFGMATKFAEVVLSIEFRQKTEDGRYVGGPMYYIEEGLNAKWLSYVFAIFAAFAAFGTGNMVQSNSVAESLEAMFGINKWVTGIVLAVLVSIAIFGGLKRIASMTEKLVPFMAVFYVVGGLIIVIMNISNVPAAFKLIFKNAFSGTAAVGGFVGSSMSMAAKMGVARGIFSNEAGLGSAPIAHAAATTDHPVRQGFWGVFEVFMATIVICTITALSIILTGVWNTGETGAVLTTMAFEQSLPFGGYIVCISILLFAFSTLLSWSYYGERAAEFIFGPKIIKPYRIMWIPFIVIGAVGGLETLWVVSDTLNGLMAIPNLIGILGLSSVVFKLTDEFFKTKYVKEKRLVYAAKQQQTIR
ncbi:AGCS family alanine or glycine:cation symporter [Keratinibaculum paraultunense]|uniref:AGCS family alanine or glycine:cation symporter n=1 Tax=Keratinibaculum paraultunense TaxID=1278232 RepID=A0A4R3KS05_9FIRM|nr:sodium:alanine symporter family protein [Keratinibaculum paraultunense]QQY79568.1 sodium:alanine symporter family protein [Keratinibaculum paraultunense]TCS87593.1 AGCS family alanine or glycine:cation symporter [Keratinibaculum paraultunense]